MSWYLKVLKQYIRFNGRSRRKEYWYFVLFNWIIILLFGGLFGLLTDGLGLSEDNFIVSLLVLFLGIYFLGTLLPGLGVAVRRLHDTNKSGWWLLLGAIPYLGGLILFIFFVQDSQPGRNKYGRNPKEKNEVLDI